MIELRMTYVNNKNTFLGSGTKGDHEQARLLLVTSWTSYTTSKAANNIGIQSVQPNITLYGSGVLIYIPDKKNK